MLSQCSSLYADAGLADILLVSKVVAYRFMNRVLDCRHYDRTIGAHKISKKLSLD